MTRYSMKDDLSPAFLMWLREFISSPKNILIVEDDYDRLQWFSQVFKNHNISIAHTGKDALPYLEQGNFDLILLDHDLSSEHYADAEQGHHDDLDRYFEWQQNNQTPLSGYDVATMISNQNVPIIIHSLNPIGSLAMRKALPGAWNIPYYSLRNAFEYGI